MNDSNIDDRDDEIDLSEVPFEPSAFSTWVKYIALLAIMLALTTVGTAIFLIPFPTTTGYFNLGDAFVMLSGLLLGPLGGFVAGGGGSATADILLAYAHFAPITFVVKGCEGMMVGLITRWSWNQDEIHMWDAVAVIVGAFVMLVGYFSAEVFLYGFEAALAELVFVNSIQVLAGASVTLLVGPTVRNFLRARLAMTRL
ncbi:MAG: ECF transporter S component [Candidatus Thorarchaeota archaeon]|nr:MAG: ECF transporter S component [Candidatus Thorarchaeota archaeon]